MSLSKKHQSVLLQITKSRSGTKIDGKKIAQSFEKAGATITKTKDPKHTWISVAAGPMAVNFSADTFVAIDTNIKLMAHFLLNTANDDHAPSEEPGALSNNSLDVYL